MKAIRFTTLEEMEASDEPGYLYEMLKYPTLWVRLPTGVGAWMPLGPNRWQVEEHEDGTITVTPSIDDRDPKNLWHGWLTRGEFVSC